MGTLLPLILALGMGNGPAGGFVHDATVAVASPVEAQVAAVGPRAVHRFPVAPTYLAASETDRWVAEDKAKHFFMSFAATGLAYGTLRAAGVDGDAATAGAAGASMSVGVWKELRDLRLTGRFSPRDLLWDAAGTALGLVLANQVR